MPEEETATAEVELRKLQKTGRESAAGGRAGFAPAVVHQVLRSSGQPLDGRARSVMERQFGHDFSGVRVHTDREASASAEAVQAHAYTVGNDIVFRAGRYEPGSRAGQRLLAHELTHVVQQGAAAPLAQRRQKTPAMAGPIMLSRASTRLQRAITTSVAEDGVASNALGACDWGLTFPETVDETCVAVKSGATWKADPTDLKGHFSKQTRLLPSEVEVTGPGGNTTSGNHCAQVGELKALGHCPGAWYMLSAVVAHENVHAAHFGPAMTAAAPNIQTDFNGVTVPDAAGKTAATALTELKATAAYGTAKGGMQRRWLTEVLRLAAPDHGGPTAAAEHAVVDPMITRICSHAKTTGWPACAACPP
jgi:hypothetical protein